MQYVEYLHMNFLTKQHLTTIQAHMIIIHIRNVFSQCLVNLTLSVLFVFYLQYQVPREFSLTMILTIPLCVLYATFLCANYFLTSC
jgi:hypothetical protein